MKLISEYPLLWLLPIAVIAAVLTWFFYVRRKPYSELASWVRRTLYSIRFLVLSLLGLLLLGLLLEYTEIFKEKPVLITLIDNSASMKNYRDSSQVGNRVEGLIREMDQLGSDGFEHHVYEVGELLERGRKINFDEGKTDLSGAFDFVFSNYYNRNIGGIVLVSDGNYNEGQNPAYAAAKIPLTPIFTLGAGDTMIRRDHLIKDVVSNEVAFLKNKFPVQVDIEANGMGKRSTELRILHQGKVVGAKTLAYEGNQLERQQVLFELEADQAGFQQYVVELRSEDGEYTTRNNRKIIYLEVLDDRHQVLLLSAAPNPDLTALKSVLETRENTEVKLAYLKDWDQELKKTDLIIWHDPANQFSTQLHRKVLNAQIPTWYFVGARTNDQMMSLLNIGTVMRTNGQLDEVQAGLNSSFELFELSEDFKREIGKFPAVKSVFGKPELSSQNKVLLTRRMVNIETEQPLLYFGSSAGRKYAVFIGDGIWRWKLAEYRKSKSNLVFSELVEKVTQYLVLKENSSNLRITLPKRFLKNEEIQFKAEFYNEAMELITKPLINLSLTNESGKRSDFQFAVNGNLYLLPLGKLTPGVYSWTAETTHDGKKYQKKGRFVVEDIQLEKLDTRANHQLLRKIALQSDGKFWGLKDYKQVKESIRKRDDITVMSFEQKSNQSLLDYWWLLIGLIVLLSVEWFLKRIYGSY
ncbi:MAG: VWA domain-containing protein [Bacteroidetes bacterium]|nr:MAG: VWA domain-containing protein [Bacteroidota bacterium]